MITYRRRLVLIAAGVVLGGCDGDRKEQVTEPAMVLDEMVMPTSCTSSCMDDATYLYRPRPDAWSPLRRQRVV